jgi:hypothetical protein
MRIYTPRSQGLSTQRPQPFDAGVGVRMGANGFGTSGANDAEVAAIVRAAGGLIFDVSDTTSLFQATTGGSTGATGQPVGIMLDKSFMGGAPAATFIAGQPEVVVNGNFATDTVWTKGAGWTIAGGLSLASLATSNLSQVGILTIGSWYRITFTVSGYVTGTLTPTAGVTTGTAVSANGTYTQVLRALTSTDLIFTGTAFTGSIGNVSAKVIPGFHAIAPSDAARPVLTVAGSQSYLTLDGVDDYMTPTPILNLGEVWWHVGGWRSDTDNRAAFATSSSFRGAVILATSLWRWYDPGDVQTPITTAGNPATINVLTVQQTATNSLSGRYNGANGATMTPFDDSAATLGVALFTVIRGVWSAGIAGRFYGGAFAPGVLSAPNRAVMERYAAGRCGVTL